MKGVIGILDSYHNHYGLSGQLSIQRIQHHLKTWGQMVLQNGLHAYSDQ
jgi:hypothetical protein